MAAKKESSRTVSYTASVNVVVAISELSDTDRYSLQIYDDNDNPSKRLDGCLIVDTEKNAVATITNANAEFKRSCVANGLNIMTTSREIIALTPKGIS